MLRGVIFDFDGVLVDSEHAHFEALRNVLAGEAGIAITLAEYADNYVGYDDQTCFRRAFEIHRVESLPVPIDDLVEKKRRAYNEGLAHIPLLPGARDLILALHEASVPLAIASGSRRHEIESLLRTHDVQAAFRGIVSADDVRNFKPHPEPYLLARDVVGSRDSGEGVVAIEDSPPGIASALAAGLRVIGITNSHPREKLGLAHRVIDSLVGLGVPGLASLTARG